nr:site-specific recombinase [Streptococcus mitis]
MDALKEEQDKVLYNREELKKYDLVWYKLSTNYGLNKCLKVFLSELGIGSQTMIATAGRYIYGSYLLSKGVDIWAVSRLLRHKDIQQIIQTYGHTLKEGY